MYSLLIYILFIYLQGVSRGRGWGGELAPGLPLCCSLEECPAAGRWRCRGPVVVRGKAMLTITVTLKLQMVPDIICFPVQLSGLYLGKMK